MSRSGYTDDCEHINLYRATVERAIRGKRGQALLKDMLAALDALPQKRLIAEALVTPDGECCALGAVAISRNLDVSKLDAMESADVGKAFNIAPALAAEIAYENDEGVGWGCAETPEERFVRIRAWVEAQIHGQ